MRNVSFHRIGVVVIVAGLSLAANGCATSRGPQAGRALPHFFQVDQALYRGGQPTEEGFRQLARRGVKTVISLRAEGRAQREAERRLVESFGMRWISLPMRPYWRPSAAQVDAFLEVVDDPARQPVFVHCRKGQVRTGTLIAIYRIVRYRWEPGRAYREALCLGLGGWNPFVQHLILYEAPREAAGMPGFAPPLAGEASFPCAAQPS